MIIRDTVTKFLSHFTYLTLIKQVLPAHMTSEAYSHITHESKPWMNVDAVELTAEDFA